MIRVRLAEASDQGDLIEFIREHWSSTHIFTQAPNVFSWQYRQADGRLNMMMAEEVTDVGSSVLGVLGFIPMGRFDPSLGDADITLAIWKVVDGCPPGLGLRLLKQLEKDLQPRMVAAIGISEIVRPIYKVLKYDVAVLDHAAIFNPSRKDHLALAQHVPEAAFAAPDESWPDNVRLVRIDADSHAEHGATVQHIAGNSSPAKSWEYVNQRYLTHPWYAYTVSLVIVDEQPSSIVVWRAVESQDARVLRIVDIIGSVGWLAGARRELLRHVVEADAEYIDVMQWGVDPDLLDAGGFVGRRSAPDIVIPNYFSPFERRNIEIALACKVDDSTDSPVRLFRADSDQDRPNSLEDVESPPEPNVDRAVN